MTYEKRIEKLKRGLQPLEPTDAMPEAGRKILRQYLIDMLKHEAGSRTGDDIEDVHKMRVAIRRMRSAMRMFAPYYQKKALQPYNLMLKSTAKVLGGVRDLDVIMDDLKTYQAKQDEATQAALQAVLDRLGRDVWLARTKLVAWLDTQRFQAFVKDFAKFVCAEGRASVAPASDVMPYEVRHIAPIIFYEHLAAVRAYDTVLEGADIETLHALRIEFKRLRYVVTFFESILGTSAEHFIEAIKDMQEYLGRLNDVTVARERLSRVAKLNDAQQAALNAYLDAMQADADAKLSGFPDAWARFNSRGVQRQLSDSILVLR